MVLVNEWLDSLAMASDVQRRSHILNILLFACTTLCLVALIGTGFRQFNKTLTPQEAVITYRAATALLLGAGVVFLINRYWSGRTAASL